MTNKENKHTIWSSDINLEDWKDFLQEEYPDSSEDEYYELVAELNSEYLEDERMNLNINVPDEIICIADLGLWNGRRSGYKMMKTKNIADCLYSDCDYVDWYCDEYGDFRCDASHHDGTKIIFCIVCLSLRYQKKGEKDSSTLSTKVRLQRQI